MKMDPAISKMYEMNLYEGESDGLILFKLEENVYCYKISKDYFEQYKNDEDIKKLKSVYILYGKGKFYVGQAGIRHDDTAITSRINEHLKNPKEDFVEEIVFFCHSSNKWGGGELDYLEASLIKYFKEQGYPMFKEQKDETIDTYLDDGVNFKYEKHLREIKIMIDILGYDAIRRLANDNSSVDIQEEPEPQIQHSTFKIEASIYNELITKSRRKVEIIKNQFNEWNIEFDANLNFASYSTNKEHYWMEPTKDTILNDWTVVLFNADKKRIVIMRIPKGSVSIDGNNMLKIRKDKPNYVKLELKDNTYIDKQSGVDFSPFVKTIINIEVG